MAPTEPSTTASTWGNDWATSGTTYVYRSDANSTFSDYHRNFYWSAPLETNSGVRSGNPHWMPFWHHFYADMPLPARPRLLVPTRAVDRRARSVHTYRPRIPVWSARRWKSLT